MFLDSIFDYQLEKLLFSASQQMQHLINTKIFLFYSVKFRDYDHLRRMKGARGGVNSEMCLVSQN